MNWVSAPGMHVSLEERFLLVRLSRIAAATFPDLNILNIGIAAQYGHCSMRCLRAGAPMARLIGVDIEEQGPVPAELGKNTEFYIMDSGEFLRQVSINYGLAFIDGDHTEPGVRRDINGILPLMLPKSVIAFHDCNRPVGRDFDHVRGVKWAVDDLMGSATDWKLGGNVDSIRYFERL